MNKLILIMVLALYSSFVQALEIGVFAGSYHFDSDENEYNEENPGVYITFDNLQAGFYKNSFGDQAYFLGCISRPYKYLHISYGVVYGYALDSGKYEDPEFYGRARYLPYIMPVLSIPLGDDFTINTHFIGKGFAWSLNKKL